MKTRFAEQKIGGLGKDVRLLASQRSGEDTQVPFPAELKGRAISSDPKCGFLIRDVVSSQGVMEYGEVLVRRGDRLMGRGKVSRVEKDRRLANLMPGWECGEILEGDVAIPATPRS